IVFEAEGGGIAKKIAGYHQFHAVNKAVGATLAASSPSGDKRCGVVWRTQGSGKSLTLIFYAGTLIVHPALESPPLVVLTDRNAQQPVRFNRRLRPPHARHAPQRLSHRLRGYAHRDH